MRSQTAASSIASGIPSSRRHSSTTASRLPSPTSKSGAGRGAVEEQPHRLVVGGVSRLDPGGRCAQRRDREDLFALDPEDVPAGGEDAQIGSRRQQLAGQHRAGVGEVLAVVEHDQEPP